jgi:endonuclease G
LIEVAEKIVQQGGEGLRMLGDDSALQKRPEAVEGLEAIVRMDGSRPSFMVVNGEIDRDSSPIGGWANRLSSSDAVLRRAIASVGRIDIPGSSAGFQGTGFLIAPDLILTNRHVLQVSAREREPGNWQFVDGAAFDCGHEYRGRNSVNRRRLRRLVYCGSKAIEYTNIDHSKLDLALIELESAVGSSIEDQPIFSLSAAPGWTNPTTIIFTIGYPGSPPSSIYPPSLLEQLFQDTYGYKRIAPGELIQSQSTVSPWTLAHDATTLGGNSGSVVIVADREGIAMGLHYGGRAGEPRENWGHVLARVLDATDGRSPKTLREILNDYGVKLDGSTLATNLRPEPQQLQPRQPLVEAGPAVVAATVVGPTSSQGIVTLQIPVRISVTVGTPSLAAGTAAAVPLAANMEQVEKVPVIYPDMDSREGYRPDFLELDSETVPLPQLTSAGKTVAARLDDGSYELKYHKFSLVMHKRRRLAMFTAANVDWRRAVRTILGKKPARKELDGFTGNEREDWVIDPRIPLDYQLPDHFYTNDGGAFDKGHLVRRDDVAWGISFEDMQKGNGDTFHTTNCSPQTAEFNRAAENNWGALENMIQKQTTNERICLFSGPVLGEDDGYFHGKIKSGVKVSIQIPNRFWKIVVFDKGGKPAAYGFILDQNLSKVNLEAEFVVPEAWKDYVRPISEIEELLGGLVKLTKFKAWDQYEGE